MAQQLTTAEMIVVYLKKHGRTRRSDLYSKIPTAEGVQRKRIRELISKGKIKEVPCNCGITRFIELVKK